MRTGFWLAAAVVVLGFLCVVCVQPALADTVVDPQIFVCQSCTAPPGGDPDLITNTSSFTVGVAGNFTLQNPLLVIVGVYNGNGTPTITFSGGVSTPIIGTYGLTATSATMVSGQDAFTRLGLASGGSESFTNWSGADTAKGFGTPTSFKLYAFALNTNLKSGSPITIGESGAANGSYLIAYDCENGTGSRAGCATPGNIGQTVFTDTGLLDAAPVPEPTTLTLFGSGLIGIAGLFRRRLVS